MIGWGRFDSSRATDAAVPLAGAVDVVSLSPHRFCLGCRRSGRSMSFTGLSAVPTDRAAPSFLAGRSHRALARRLCRAEAPILRRTGRSADAGLVPRTGRTPGDNGQGTAGRTFLGGAAVSTGRRIRPISSRPYRTVGGFHSVPGKGLYRLFSRTGHAHLGGFGGRSTTSACTSRSLRSRW